NHFRDDLRVDSLATEAERCQESIVACDADRPGDAHGTLMNHQDRFARKDPRCVRSRSPHASGDVRGRLLSRKRFDSATYRDPLFQLSEPGLIESVAKLRLAGEHHRQQLFSVGFTVREQANLLEQLSAQALCFVDNQCGYRSFCSSPAQYWLELL